MNRFRVAVRKAIYFQDRIAKKGPKYANCNERQTSCTNRKAQPRLGCPTCEYTVQYKIFREELDKELESLKHGTRTGARRWPSKLLLELVVETGTLANSIEGYDPNWTVVVTNLVSIYRSEGSKKRTIESYISPVPTDGPLIKDNED